MFSNVISFSVHFFLIDHVINRLYMFAIDTQRVHSDLTQDRFVWEEKVVER